MICKKNNRFKVALKVVISLFLVFLLIINVKWAEVWKYIINANIYFISIYLVFYFLGLLISARKWQILANFKKFTNFYLFYFKSYLLGTFLNNFLPSFIGGDAYRIYSLGKPVNRVAQSSTTIIIDRISGLLGIMILSIIFAFMNRHVLMSHDIIVWMIFGFSIITISFFVVIFLFHAKFVQFFIKLLPRFIQRYVNQLLEFRRIGIAFKVLGYSFLFAIVGIAIANYSLFKALDICLSPQDYISVIFLSSIISAVPISVGNIGVKEWAYVFLFGIFGVSSSVAVTVVILSRVLQMLVSLIAVPFYIQSKNILYSKS